MIRLSKEQIIALHTELIRETGGRLGIRSESLLDSALNAPFQVFENIGYNYPVTTPIIIGSLHLVLIAIHTLSRYSTTSFLNARNSSDAACCLKDGPPSPNG